MTENPKTCSHCGGTLTGDAAGGLCPRCLMAMNFDSRTMHPGEEPTGMPPLPPEEIADRFPGFEILECLGRGGMGVVYKARQKSLDRLVAIKILPPEGVGEEAFSERFAREAATLAKLSHPNIVTVHDFGEAAGLFYIVMEYVDGVNLRDLLREGKLEAKQALAIVPPICEALQYAHDKGIVHRDIKPENLLLDRDGRVKIADFGIASLVGASGESAGTPPYMAPEQSGGRTDHRADIYALGVVLYEMLTGERPEKDVVAPSRKVQVDVRIDEMVLRALEKEPELRYQTAVEFRTAVETMAPQALPARPSSSAPANQTSGPVGGAPDGGNEESSRQRIQWPAVAMAVVGGINVVGSVLGLLVALLLTLVPLGIGASLPEVIFPPWLGSPITEEMIGVGRVTVAIMILMAGWMLMWLGAWVFAFVSALRMWRLKNRGWAIAAAIIFVAGGLIGFLFANGPTPAFTAIWSMIELGVGIWALVSLLHPDAQRAFENRKPDVPSDEDADSSARSRVAAPTTGLMVASAFNLLLVAAALFLVVLYAGWDRTATSETLSFTPPGMSYMHTTSPPPPRPLWTVLFPFAAAFFVFVPSLLTFISAWQMRRLQGYGMAIVGSVLGILTPPGLLIGVIFGIWSLVVLSRREVREAFGADNARPVGKSLLVIGGVVAGIVLLGILARFGLPLMHKAPREKFEVVASASAPAIPGQITQKSLSAAVGGELFLDLEAGRVFTRKGIAERPSPELLRASGIDMSVKFEEEEPQIIFWNCSTNLFGSGGLLIESAMQPDFVEPGWGKSLRQIAMELPVPAADTHTGMGGEFPTGVLVRTRNGSIALEITRYHDAATHSRQLDMRYVLLPPGGMQQADKLTTADPRVRSYAVGKTFTALAADASGQGPEHILARTGLALLDGDAAKVLAENEFGLVEFPAGSVSVTMSEADAAIFRNTEVLRVAIHDEDLAVVVIRLKGTIVSLVYARRDGVWKCFGEGELPDVGTEEEAVAGFLARVETLRAEIAKASARDPKLLEEATAEMTAQLGTMMRSLTNQMGKIVEKNHPIPGAQAHDPGSHAEAAVEMAGQLGEAVGTMMKEMEKSMEGMTPPAAEKPAPPSIKADPVNKDPVFTLRWVAKADDKDALELPDATKGRVTHADGRVEEDTLRVSKTWLLEPSMLREVGWNRWKGFDKSLFLILKNDADILALQETTGKRIGDQIAVVWRGRVIGVLKVEKPLANGIKISLSLPDDEASAIEKELNAAVEATSH